MTMQADELKGLRKSVGWTQDQLAEAIGVSRVLIGQMERGQAPIERRTGLAVRYVIDHADDFSNAVAAHP